MLRHALCLLALAAPAEAFIAHRREPKMAMVTPLPKQQSNKMRTAPLAMVIPGDSLAEVIIVDGGLNFLSIYMGLLTLRILLSWFPQAQGVALLRPLFTVSDVYLNLFRGVIPPIGGIDISPIGAFFTLNLLTNSVASLGATGPLPDRTARCGALARASSRLQGMCGELQARLKGC